MVGSFLGKSEEGVSIWHKSIILNMCESMYNPNVIGYVVLADKLEYVFGT